MQKAMEEAEKDKPVKPKVLFSASEIEDIFNPTLMK